VKAKVIIVVGVVLVAALLGVVFGTKKHETRPAKALVGLDSPELSVGDPSGATVRLADLKGTVVFVNYWATWCPPCREEMPSIQNLYRRFRDEKGFRMVTILYRDDYQKAMAYLKDNNYDFPVMLDIDGKSAAAYGVTGVPETYIIDRKGTLRQKMIGPFDWSSPEAVSFISDLMKQ
jgi:DsbE subfamily thiol:disulfide oxidoreductase